MAADLGSGAAELAGVPANFLANPVVARQILSSAHALIELSLRVEREGEDPLRAGRDLLEEAGLKPDRAALKPPMPLTEAIEIASRKAPTDVEKKIRAVGRLALAFFGDVPVATLSRDRVQEFLKFVWNMPKNWGQRHGKNRFDSIGSELDVHEIKRMADAEDAATLAEVLADTSLSLPEKRHRLVQKLRPRLVDSYLYVQRDMFNRIVRAALGAAATGRQVEDEDRLVPSHTQLKACLIEWHKEAWTECGLPTRVSRPKRRRSWSFENLVKLFRSPIYAGTSSAKQRWRKARASRKTIVRDALYWVPLLMITMGVRPEEVLQLKIKNVRRRDGLLCLFLGEDLDDRMKAEQSRRVLPVPQLLLDLGFREWIVEKSAGQETFLFPDVPPSAADGRRSQIFGNRMRTLLDKLDLKFSDEDIYAMRRTLSSKLLGLRVDTGVRQRILGHLEGTTVDRHYSDDGLAELKAQLDQVDYGVKVGRCAKQGFPVISGCAAPILPSLDLIAFLDDAGNLRGVQLSDPDTDEQILTARVKGAGLLKDDAIKDFPILTAKELADALLALKSTYAFILPVCEESVAAVEHLLILAGPPVAAVQSSGSSRDAADSKPVGTAENRETAPGNSESEAVAVAGTCPEHFRPGDTAICVFPLRRQGGEGRARPGLVVNIRTLAGRRYLDIAQGSPGNHGHVAPHHLVVCREGDLEAASLSQSTCFDLRRRILVAEDDATRIHRRLGTLTRHDRTRLKNIVLSAGDVSPAPVAEMRPMSRPKPKTEVRRSKLPAGRDGRPRQSR